jgi:pimeloyl-ACP methyl ester carboxylesterase
LAGGRESSSYAFGLDEAQRLNNRKALKKRFEASGHEPFVDEPTKFNGAMAELVRPGLG